MQFLWILSGLRNAVLNEAMLAITEFGQQTILIVILCTVYWCYDKRIAQRAAFSFCLSGLAVQNLQLVFRVPRPWILDKKFCPVKAAVPAATGFSFPSGHTQGATSIYWSLFVSGKGAAKWLRILLAGMPLVVGFSRMYLGCHTPKDVGVAMLVAAICVFVVEKVYPFIENKTPILQYLLPMLCVLGAIGSIVHGYLLYQAGMVEYRNVIDCAKGGGVALGFVVGYLLEIHFVNFEILHNRGKNAIRLIIGLILLVLLKGGLKALLGTTLVLTIIRYAILILFIIVGYPWLFTMVNKNNKK